MDEFKTTIKNYNNFLKLTDYQLTTFENNNLSLWNAHTIAIRLGEVSRNGTQNEINYFIYGQEKHFVNELRITLNLKVLDSKSSASSELFSVANTIFSDLDLQVPPNLIEKISKGEHYYHEDH